MITRRYRKRKDEDRQERNKGQVLNREKNTSM